MQNTFRLPVTAGMVVAGAGLLAVAPLSVPMSAQQSNQADMISAAVELTGVADTWVDAFAGSAGFFTEFLTDFPGQLMAAGQQFLDAPGQLPSITVDVLGQLVGTPDVTNTPASLFSGTLGPLVVALGQTLPAPLGASGAGDGLFINAMGGVNLLLQSFWSTGAGLNGLGSLVPNLADWVEAAPGQLLSAVATGVAHPEDIPGLFTYLLNGVFGGSPDLMQTPTLLSSLTGPLTVALANILPAPLGAADGADMGLFMEGMIGINGLVEKAFDLLPDPINPAIALGDLTGLSGDLFSGFGDVGSNLGDLLGNIPLVGDAFQWLIDAIMTMF